MSDAAESVGPVTESLADGYLTLEYEPLSGGQIRLTAKANGETLESGEYNTKIFGSATLKGQFLNSVEMSLEGRSAVDATKIRRELKEWFAEMNQLDKEEQKDKLLTDEVAQIIDGTHSVKVHGGETTVWKVTLTFAGRTKELEFTASEMVSGSGGALQEKIANQFYELVEIEKEDWEAIRERWQEQSEVVSVVDETASDAVADRVLEYLKNNLIPVGDREKMGNDVAAVWYDGDNATVCDDAPTEGPIAWVQGSFLSDQLESAGKNLEYKSTLVRDLIDRGDLYSGSEQRKWAWDTRTRVYPFNPESLGISEDDVVGGSDPSHSEVKA
ncbi:hypothetical protein [Halorhabdus amylolytica]|uniref:hypothetical protein n=1 Tax=Halorhabdus amylolytica TaxID=2559573 RepID=UPI0010A9F883|nr:hypothetical protein [Halorhabdus amylolytica]